MEIDVTKYVEEIDCFDFSASAAEMGQNAGQITWQNATDHILYDPIVSAENMDEARDYIVSTGGWTEGEVGEMSDQEVNALVLQFVAGAVREYEDHFSSYEEYIEATKQGQVCGNLWRNDDGTWTYYLGV